MENNKQFDSHYKSVMTKLDEIKAAVDYLKEQQRKDKLNHKFYDKEISEVDKELDHILNYVDQKD